jgi:hypothetical protein
MMIGRQRLRLFCWRMGLQRLTVKPFQVSGILDSLQCQSGYEDRASN